MSINQLRVTIMAALTGIALATPPTAMAQGFGGPDAVENQLKSDRQQVDAQFDFEFLDPWFAFKDGLAESTGLSFGIDYTAVGFTATDSLGEDSAGAGMVRLFGAWELIGRGTPNSGAFVFKAEHRHSYTDVPPSGLGFETGYVGLTGAPFNDQGSRLTNLYWRQRLLDGRATVIAGLLDVTDYVDVYALGSPWTHYMNLAFSTGGGTIGAPGEATLGAAGAVMLTDHIYAIAGIADANADPTKPFKDIDSFFDDSDYFTSLDIGWTPSQERLIFDNVHATIWHTDGSRKFFVPDGWGIAASANWWVDDQWMPFLRGGYAEDGGVVLQKSISAGVAYQPKPGPGHNVIGLGFNWGEPNEDSFGPGLDDQYTVELFYRVNLGKHLAVTPDVQVIFNPALNPEKDVIGIFGLRARIQL
jgi:porin